MWQIVPEHYQMPLPRTEHSVLGYATLTFSSRRFSVQRLTVLFYGVLYGTLT